MVAVIFWVLLPLDPSLLERSRNVGVRLLAFGEIAINLVAFDVII